LQTEQVEISRGNENVAESGLLVSGSGSVVVAESSANENENGLRLYDRDYVRDVHAHDPREGLLSYAGGVYFVIERSRCANGPWASHQNLHVGTVIGLLQILLSGQRLHQIRSSRRLQVRTAYSSLDPPFVAARQTDFARRMADFALE
jgi:hypothetical protein